MGGVSLVGGVGGVHTSKDGVKNRGGEGGDFFAFTGMA